MESLKFIFPSRMSDAKVFVPTGEFGLGNLKSVKKASKKSPVQEDPTNPIVEQAPKRTGLDVSLGLQSIEVKAAPVSQKEAERKALGERLAASKARTLQKRKEEKEQAKKNIAAREANRKLMQPSVPESEKAVLQGLAAQYKSLGHYERE